MSHGIKSQCPNTWLQGIYTWFHTYGQKRESIEKFRDMKKWTARKVLGIEADTDLKNTIRTKSGGWNGSESGKADNQRAFGMYQAELTKVWDRTSDEEKQRLELVAELWNQMGPPAAQQAK